MRRHARHLAGFALAALLSGGGCMDRLPDQDLRIVGTLPTARLSADILRQEYDADRAAADAAYWGEAIIVTGIVEDIESTTVEGTSGVRRTIFFGSAGPDGIEARLLDEQADSITANVETGQRLTLKCFCEGLAAEVDGRVLLKSCVRP